MRSTSTVVIVFQKARVVFGSTRCFGSPSSETMATSVGPACTISKCSAAIAGCVLAIRSALSAGDLRAHDLHDLRRQMAAEVERHEAARLEHAHEAAVARQERALVVLDDNLELEQHDTSPIRFLLSPLSPSLRGEGRGEGQRQTAGQRLCLPSPNPLPTKSGRGISRSAGRMSHAEATDQRLSRWHRDRPRLAASAPIRRSGTPVPGLGLGAKGGIRAGAERRDVCLSGRHLGRSLDVSRMSWEAAGFPVVWLA